MPKNEKFTSDIKVSFCLNQAYDDKENPIYLLKISAINAWELNILCTEQELEMLCHLRNLKQNGRNSPEIGKCLNSPVFWSYDEKFIDILIGEDTETWDIGFCFPEKSLDCLFEEIKKSKDEFVIKDNDWFSIE